MFNIARYINDFDFQFVYLKNELNVINYETINYMEDTKISLTHKIGTIIIKGNNLRVKKLLENEMIITGTINNLELRND